jgi:hypothetical protein
MHWLKVARAQLIATHGNGFRLIWWFWWLTHLFVQQPVALDREAEQVPAHTAVTRWWRGANVV